MKWLTFSVAIAVLLFCLMTCGLILSKSKTPGNIDLPKEIVHEKDGSTMVLIPAGEFIMGSTDEEISRWEDEAEALSARRWFTDEAPQHRVYLAAYYIDKYEVTNAQYCKFVAETNHPPPRYRRRRRGGRTFDKPDLPVMGVNWEDAVAYAKWVGKRLPTEAEWEKAARGTDGIHYPWGNVFDHAKCNAYLRGSIGPQPVGSCPQGASPYGVLDMAGNIWEWCADWHSSDYYAKSPYENPQGPKTGEEKVLRGGAWWVRMPASETRCAYRGGNAPSERHSNYGFRLVKEIAK